MVSIRGRWEWLRALPGADVKGDGPAALVHEVERMGFAGPLDMQYGSGDGAAHSAPA